MQRRTFLHAGTAALAAKALAENPMPMATLGKTGMNVSKITLGGGLAGRLCESGT